MRTGFSSWRRRVGTMRRRRARWWCGKGRMGRWGSSTGGARCDGARSPLRRGRRSSKAGPLQPRKWASRGGCRRRIILGGRRRGGRGPAKRGSRKPARGGRGPCPPLRPKRSPCGLAGLRSGQGPREKQKQKNQRKTEKQEKGTFLKSFDSTDFRTLTLLVPSSNLAY